MNAERVSTEAVLAMRRIAVFVANMISVGGCASAGFAEAGALVPTTPVGRAPLTQQHDLIFRLTRRGVFVKRLAKNEFLSKSQHIQNQNPPKKEN
jgi:hypothetical protein